MTSDRPVPDNRAYRELILCEKCGHDLAAQLAELGWRPPSPNPPPFNPDPDLIGYIEKRQSDG